MTSRPEYNIFSRLSPNTLLPFLVRVIVAWRLWCSTWSSLAMWCLSRIMVFGVNGFPTFVLGQERTSGICRNRTARDSHWKKSKMPSGSTTRLSSSSRTENHRREEEESRVVLPEGIFDFFQCE